MEAKNIQCPICNGVAYDTQISYLSNPPQYGFLCECCKEMTYLGKYPNNSFLSQTKSNSVEWINVNDRLPDADTQVLVCSWSKILNKWRYGSAVLQEEGYFYSNFIGFVEDTLPVQYWHLPEPPKQ